jgi:Ni/Co efflux regulator RcnB
MPIKKFTAIFASISLLSASMLSFAAPNDHWEDRDQNPPQLQNQQSKKNDKNSRPQPNSTANRDARNSPARPGGGYRESSNQVTRHDQGRPNHVNQRGPQPREDWKRGDRVPAQYRGSDRYYVNDWRARDLPPPPRNHRWIEVNGDYVLVAVATGIITSILIGHHH